MSDPLQVPLTARFAAFWQLPDNEWTLAEYAAHYIKQNATNAFVNYRSCTAALFKDIKTVKKQANLTEYQKGRLNHLENSEKPKLMAKMIELLKDHTEKDIVEAEEAMPSKIVEPPFLDGLSMIANIGIDLLAASANSDGVTGVKAYIVDTLTTFFDDGNDDIAAFAKKLHGMAHENRAIG
ncbi:hypothetical protein HDU90_002586 [Geranomyces variabilis]|nr:hypothetical protein HDU90_002586 [Geranomyces variabilis]